MPPGERRNPLPPRRGIRRYYQGTPIATEATALRDWLEATLGIGPPLQDRLLSSLATVAVLALARALVVSLLHRRLEDIRDRYRWRKTTTYATVALGLVLVGRIWFAGLQQIATFLGLLSAGLAIALKDIVSNLAGWAFILWRRPFEVGDRVQIGGHTGDVIDLRLFQFTLLEVGNWVDAEQSTGRMIHVPNGLVLTHPLANYTTGFEHIWDEIAVLITFESNWRKAKDILTAIADKYALDLTEEARRRVQEASRRFLIFYTKLTPVVYTSVRDHGVLLTIRYMSLPRERRGKQEIMWEAILTEFGKWDDIDFAYPTTRFYDNRAEGKTGAGG